MLNANDTVEDLLNFVTTIENKKTKLYKDVETFNQMLIDLDHELELKPMNGGKMLKLVKERKDILLERRKIKDELTMVVKLSKKFPQMSNIYGQVKGIINESKKIEEELQNRFYRPRVLTDRFETPQELNKEREEDETVDIVQKRINDGLKLKKVDKANVIKRRSPEVDRAMARLDVLIEQVSKERKEKEKNNAQEID